MVINVMKQYKNCNFYTSCLVQDFYSRSRVEVYSGEAYLPNKINKIIYNSVANDFSKGNLLTRVYNLSQLSDLMIIVKNTIVDFLNDINFFIPCQNNESYFYIKPTLYYITNLVFETTCFGYLFTKLSGLFDLNIYLIRNVCVVVANILEEIIKEKYFSNILESGNSEKKFTPTNMSHMNKETHWVMRCVILTEIKKGINNSEIAKNLNVNRRSVASIRTLFNEDKYLQFSDLKPNKPGPKKDPHKRISEKVHGELVNDLTKTPLSFGIKSSTWTGSAIKEYLEKIHKINVPLYYVYSFCRNNNITSKFARRVNPKQDIDLKEDFIKNRYRNICKYALSNGYEIIFGDETSAVRKHHKKGYSLKGRRTPIDYNEEVQHTNAGLFTLMSPSGLFKSFSYLGSFNSKRFIEFLIEFHEMFPDKKFIVILDNARWHKSKDVLAWLSELEEKGCLYLKFEWLPPYCPEINPVEYFNNDFKHYLNAHPTRNKIEVILDVDNYFFDLNDDINEKDRIIKSFFLGESCSYSMMVYQEVLESLGTIAA